MRGGVFRILKRWGWVTICFGSLACQQKMADQPRYKPLAKSDIFEDERAARPLVEGTVARGHLRANEPFETGKINGKLAEAFPFAIDRQLLLRGRERYNIFCSPCHDQVGNGQGMIVRRGYRPPPSYHIDRLRTAPPGHFFDRQQFFRSYLMAYVFWLGIPLGCFGIVMIHHLVGGTWGFVIQRPLESAIRTFPVMALLFLPVFFGLPDLYVWARPEAVAHDKILQQKSLYLNVSSFSFRAALYFGIWILVGTFLTRWSREQDRTANTSLVERLQNLSGPGLVLYGLTVTFSAIDWLMSLEPRWYSTIFGMIFMVSHGLVALTFVIAVAYFLSRREPLGQIIAPWVFHDLGNLLLAFVMLWAYM